MKRLLLLISTVCTIVVANAQELIVPLWGDKIPNRQETSEMEIVEEKDIRWIQKVQVPSIEVYLPTGRTASGAAVVICPGGGYQGLAYDWEGTDIAKWFNSQGIAGIVLKYRLPTSESVIKPHEVPLQDAQRAIRLVRQNASAWNIDPDQVGIMGFSAGGHLASTLSTHYNEPIAFEGDQIDQLKARPDFAILIYPVISFKPAIRHQGSMNALIGASPSQAMMDRFSNELHVDSNSPPTFLVHSTDDKAVPVENSIVYFQALQDSGVPAEMHIYPEGGHGYSLGLQYPEVQSWPTLLEAWLRNLELE